MKYSDYSHWAKRAADWADGYFKTLKDRPVRAQVKPGDIAAQIAPSPPDTAEEMEAIFADFERIIPGGMTHWQHPRFFGYFSANAAPASMIAENLANAMAAQCMLWQTSPAATELENCMIGWLRQALGLPDHFGGVIQEGGSAANLAAILTMREKALEWRGNISGLAGEKPLRIYASEQNHSSVDKAVRIAGLGQENLVIVPTDDDFAMNIEALEQAIEADKKAGLLPAGVVMCVGGTSIGATDRIAETIAVAKRHDLYTHIDAAWAGTAMICPELRPIWEGADRADSIVFNPHKWMGAQFDCSVQFLADPKEQWKTLALQPDYLGTPGTENTVNQSELTISLGRRFRALKLWFVLRAYGLEGLRERIRNHIGWSKEVEAKLAAHPDFRIKTDMRFSLFTFQYAPEGRDADEATETLLTVINDDGRIYLTQTRHDGAFVIRFQAGQFDCTREDVLMAYDVITELAEEN